MANFTDAKLPKNREMIAKAHKEANANNVSEEKKKALLKRMGNGDRKVITAYAEELIPKIDLNVWGQTLASEFFTMGTVSLGDPLWYELEYEVDPKSKIKFMSQHGGTPSETVVGDGDLKRIHPYFIQTPELHMNKLSLRQGGIDSEEKLRRKAERNMSKKIDKDMWALLRAGLSTDLENDMGIVLDEDYKNFPAANDIDATVEEGLTLEIFKTIADHFNRVGRTINNIYVPSNRIKDIYDWVSIPAGYDTGSHDSDEVVPSAVHEEVVRSGQLSTLFGYPVNLVATNVLDGTEGNDDGDMEMWISTNAPAGEYRDVRELDNTYPDEDASRVYMTMTKGLAMFQPGVYLRNYARVLFDSE